MPLKDGLWLVYKILKRNKPNEVDLLPDGSIGRVRDI